MNVSISESQSPKRILYVITKALWGGAQRYVLDLAVAAKIRGYDVIVAYGQPGPLTEQLAKHGIEAVQVSALGRDIKLKNDMSAFGELVRFIKKIQPSIIHLNSTKAGVLGALAARCAGVPEIIFTAHSWAFNEDRPVWQKIIFACIQGASVLLSTYTICVSDAVRKDIQWLPFSRKKLQVIRNGISCPALFERNEAQAKLFLNDTDSIWIGMISELHPTKRIEDAIQAMQIVHQEFPQARLMVLGDGQKRSMLEKMILELNLQETVILQGFVSDASSHLKAFDIFMHTSRSEGLGYVLLEAGCAGLPVVATRVGGIPEIITGGKSGLLVPRERPDLIADALASLLTDADRRTEFGNALHDRVLRDFTKERMIEKTFALYR